MFNIIDCMHKVALKHNVTTTNSKLNDSNFTSVSSTAQYAIHKHVPVRKMLAQAAYLH